MTQTGGSASAKQVSPVRFVGQVLLRVLITLVLLGAVLGAWRYLGQGLGVGSPGWLNNAFDSVGRFFDWAQRTSDDVSRIVPTRTYTINPPTISVPRPTPTAR